MLTAIRRKYRSALMQIAQGCMARVMRLDWPGKSTEPLTRMREEVQALPKIVSDYVHYAMDERAVLAARKARRYDPGAMLNETFNRAQDKQADHGLTDLQMKALAVQKQTLERRAARQ